MNEITGLIADDHAIVRMGLVALLESDDAIRVVGEADGGAAAVRKALRLRPDVVIMDLLMPEGNGIAATREIKAANPATKVLILTTSTVSDDLARALQAGADGIVTKATANAKLLSAIRAVTPHPKGFVGTELYFDRVGGVKGNVTLPAGTGGVFVWKGRSLNLKPGSNEVSIVSANR